MRKWVVAICILLALGLMPQVMGTYYLNLLTLSLILALFAVSYDFIFGYLRLVSLGHAAFFGVAAYSIGIFSKQVSGSFWLNFLVAFGMVFCVAALFGLLALRTREAYFFMITLALAQMLWAIAIKWRSFTGGDDGISGILKPKIGLIHWSLGDATAYFYFVLLFFVVAFMLMAIMVRSPFGRIIVGIRENELRMRAFGYNTGLYKYIWFVISGIFAGVAGILFVYFNGFVNPAALSAHMSAEGLIMVILGGPATLIGPAIGAVIIVFLQHTISAWTERWLFFLGSIYVLVVFFMPQGILGLFNKILLKKKANG